MLVEKLFKIPKSVIESVKKHPYKFGFDGFGELVYYTNYSRLLSNGTQETWIDTCIRVVEGVLSIRKSWYKIHSLKWDEQYWESIAGKLLYYIYTLKILPPGRGLWASGTAYVYERGSMALNNCAASLIEPETFAEDLGWVMDALMCGTGVGVRPIGSDAFKEQLFIPHVEANQFTIEDSREGWVKSVIGLLNSYRRSYNKHDRAYVFDYDQIRKKGEKITGFGGTASGPKPLIILHERIREYMKNYINNGATYDYIRLSANIVNAIGACIIAGNVRRCLPKGTLVHTKIGLVRIEDVCVGDKVLTAKGYKNVIENIFQGEQDLIRVITELGEVECTQNHKIAILDHVYNYSWKNAKDIMRQDTLVFVSNLIEGTQTKLPSYVYVKPNKHSTTCKNITVPKLDSDMSWFFGMFHGNGYVFTNQDKNGFNAYVSLCTHKEYKNIFYKCDEQLKRFGINTNKPLNKDNCIRVGAQSKQLALYLSQFKVANTSINIPDFILKGRIQIRGSYLAGLFDSDGSCKTRPLVLISSIYPKFLKQVQALYATLGITTRLKRKRVENGNWKALYQLTLIGKLAIKLFREFIRPYSLKYVDKGDYKFNSSLDTIIDNKIAIKVIEIKSAGSDKTYDLSVEGRNEFVIQEGILVHNSAELILGSPYDETFKSLSDYDLFPERAEIGWMSNNSYALETKNDFTRLDDIANSICEKGEGGLINFKNIRKYSRFGDASTPDNANCANPCVEIPIYNKGLCNLFEVYPSKARSKKEFLEMCRLAAIYTTSVSLLPTHSEVTNQVIVKNRRIGVSLSGVADWFDSWGGHIVKFMRSGYNETREFANYLNAEAGVVAPIRITTVKPSGSVSQLSGVSPGMHFPIHGPYAIRRMRISNTSQAVELCRQAGLHIEPDVNNKETTQVIEYPIYTGTTRSSHEVSAWEQFSLLALLQREWSDNMVSCTIHFTEGEKKDIPRMLAYFLPTIKSVSLLLKNDEMYPQMPYEKISEGEHKRRTEKMKKIDWTQFGNSDGKEAKFCSNDSCEI